MPRGRPPSVDNDSVIQAILNHRHDIICDGKSSSFVQETHSVWTAIAEELLHKIKPSSLYSYVVNNRFSLKNLLLGPAENVLNDETTKNLNDSTSSTLGEKDCSSSKKNTDLGFVLTLSKNEFDDLILETQRQTRDKKGKRKFRMVNILKPQKWTEMISKSIYDEYRLPHGYHFKNSHINRDKTSGGFTGEIEKF